MRRKVETTVTSIKTLNIRLLHLYNNKLKFFICFDVKVTQHLKMKTAYNMRFQHVIGGGKNTIFHKVQKALCCGLFHLLTPNGL